jgi:BirA family transcriptional regulator, biotin operon repressor / biotin---[acetyl-CoA-carboxylase] ligase
MPGPPPADLARAIAAAVPRLGPFARIEYFAEVESTNDIALARAAAGAPHGLVIIADMQRAGRGRHGRDWFSPPGAGLYMSAIVRRDAWGDAPSLVTLAGGVGVARGLKAATGLALELKWPNDVVIGRPWRKLAGILSESATVGARMDAVVVGIGVNLRHSAFPAALAGRATAIEMETDRPVDPAACAVEVLAAFAEVVRMLGRGDHAAILDAWRQFGRAGLGGAPVHWNDRTGERRGRARDLDEGGALLVEADGRIERLVAGEVLWDRMSRE